MTVYFMNAPLEFITLPDSIRDLDEEIRTAGKNRDYPRYNNILITLYRDGRMKELLRILRSTYSEKEINKGLKNIEKLVKGMEEDTDTDKTYMMTPTGIKEETL